MSDIPQDKLTDEIMAMFANTKMEAQQSYLQRGRAYGAQSVDDLKAGWIAQLSLMADAAPNLDRQLMDDFEAELRLRGIEAPADAPEAADALKRLIARSKVATDGWSGEKLMEVEDNLQRELDKVRPSKEQKN